jgi:EAL domain-containing protein (putative c-di-GMP-specific phosphodiesterase class I)
MSTTTDTPLSRYLRRPRDDADAAASVRGMLRAIRTHLGMDVAFLSQFTDGRRVFRSVDSALAEPPVREGASDPIEESFCGMVIDGRLPELIQNANDLPAARALDVTAALPVGAHLSVPVRLADGTTYGTFCCFSLGPDDSLTDRDVALMRVFADMAAEQIDREIAEAREEREARERITAAVRDGCMAMVYQPVIDLRDHEVMGFEALTRFTGRPRRTPDVWFAEAAAIGAGLEPEVVAAAKGLHALEHLPSHHFLSVNVSPETILSDELGRVLAQWPTDRIVLEITEHAAVLEYAALQGALARLRTSGVRIAIDDAGAGHASFRHVVHLAPDIIKLDMGITRHIDADRSRRALAAALVGFARETGAQIVAEGVETHGELTVLQELGVDAAQGYLLGQPMTCARAVAFTASRSRQGTP